MQQREFTDQEVPSFIPKPMRREWLKEFRENMEILELPEHGAWALACKFTIGHEKTEALIGPRSKFTRARFKLLKSRGFQNGK